MFAPGVGVNFVLQRVQGQDNFRTRIFRKDDLINISQRGCLIGTGKFFLIFENRLSIGLFRVLRVFNLLSENDINSAFSAHHRNFGSGITVIDVAANVLARHYIISPAIPLAGDDRYLGDSGFTERIEELSPMPDNASRFHVDSREKAGDINKGDEWDIEAVAETDEACRLD